MSALIPGTGQLLLGQRRKGCILLLLFVAVLLCVWPLRLPRFAVGLALLWVAWINLSIHAAYGEAWSNEIPEGQRPSKWWVAPVLVTALLVLWFVPDQVMLAAGFQFFDIPITSMEPTIRRGDHILADMNYYSSRGPKDREIIVFKREGTFFLGKILTEPYAQHTGQPEPWMNDFGPIIVPSGEYFVLGDNRDFSLDSRYQQHGFVSSDSIVGKPLYVIVNFGSKRAWKAIN